MSFRRSLLIEQNLWFDDRFGWGSAIREESDLCLRLANRGYHVWYDPASWLEHLEEESGGCHDLSTRSLAYQLAFYHNHFLLGLKNLSVHDFLRFSLKLFDCHVLGRYPCHKSGGLLAMCARATFYFLGFVAALWSLIFRKTGGHGG